MKCYLGYGKWKTGVEFKRGNPGGCNQTLQKIRQQKAHTDALHGVVVVDQAFAIAVEKLDIGLDALPHRKGDAKLERAFAGIEVLSQHRRQFVLVIIVDA